MKTTSGPTLLAIDHGNSFSGSHWTIHDLEAKCLEALVFDDARMLFKGFDDIQNAEVAVSHILRRHDAVLAALEEAASASALDISAKIALKSFLEKRIKALPELVSLGLRNAASK